MEVSFLAQGRVDAILIRVGGKAVFIDSGFRSNGIDCVKKMRAMGISKLDAYIGTHGHKNHIGGAGAIIHAMNPDVIYIPHKRVREAIIRHAAKGAERQAVENAAYIVVKPGNGFVWSGADFQCLGPLKIKDCSPGAYAENANSLVLRVRYGARSMLLTGDTSSAILNTILARDPNALKVEVLKNPHHNGALPLATLRKIEPQITVLCSNALPSKAYQKRIESVGSKWYSASKKGSGGHGRITLMTTLDGWEVITGN